MEILKLNWDVISQYCHTLSSKIKNDKFRPDLIVTLSRGGLVPARLLSDLLNIKPILVIGLELYSGVGKKRESIGITQEITSDLKGKKILLVDDISDSGTSLAFAKNYLIKKGAASVKSATLHYKSESKFKPDYFVQTTRFWVCYPWEINEVESEIDRGK